jgi:hypothetical protein
MPRQLELTLPVIAGGQFSLSAPDGTFCRSGYPGTQTSIFAYLLRLTESGYVKHLCSILPGNYISYARMRLKNLNSSTVTLATEYLTKFGFGLGNFSAKKLILVKILSKGKPQFTAYIQLPKLFDQNPAPSSSGPTDTML